MEKLNLISGMKFYQYVKAQSIGIGDEKHRGKGLGQQIVSLLLDFSFTNFDIGLVELNVFDWNTAAIKCYEKVGFTINPGKTIERKLKDKTWIAINMTMERRWYEEEKQLSKITSPQDLSHNDPAQMKIPYI